MVRSMTNRTTAIWNRFLGRKNGARRRTPASRRRRAFLESLESRSLLAVFTWDGGSPTDGDWTTAANWVGDVAPSPNDNLVFPVGAARLTNVNDYAAGTSFGAILLDGSNYAMTG